MIQSEQNLLSSFEEASIEEACLERKSDAVHDSGNRPAKDTEENHKSDHTAKNDQGIELSAAGFKVFKTFSAAESEQTGEIHNTINHLGVHLQHLARNLAATPDEQLVVDVIEVPLVGEEGIDGWEPRCHEFTQIDPSQCVGQYGHADANQGDGH